MLAKARKDFALNQRFEVLVVKHGIKIIAIILVLVILISTGISLFLALKGKSFLIGRLETLTQKKVDIGYLKYKFPATLEINKLNIEGLIKAEYISLSPSLIGSLRGQVIFNDIKLAKPEVSYERIATSPTSSVTSGRAAVPAVAEKSKLKRLFYLMVKRVNIKDGKLNFIDHTVGAYGLRITVKDINFSLTNARTFSRSFVSNFKLQGNIPWQEGSKEGKLYVQGWIDLLKKEMQANLKIEGIDGVYLYPYYANWIDLEKARIAGAKLNFDSEIKGSGNNIVAESRLELTDIVRKPRAPEEEEKMVEKIASAVLDAFRSLNQGKIILNFTIRTKLDQPVFSFGNDIRIAIRNQLVESRKGKKVKAGDITVPSLNFFARLVKSISDLTKAMSDSIIGFGSVLKTTAEASFKK